MSIDNKNIIINSRNKKSCIYNKNNKKHVFLNEEIINYLLEGIKNELTFLEFIDAFHEEDKEYIIRILEFLNDIDMFVMKETKTERIKSINIALTHKCNLECKHCWSEWGDTEIRANPAI